MHPLLDALLAYKTVKVVQIKNWKLGLIHYLLMLAIVGYVIGWVIVYKKGYQGESSLIGMDHKLHYTCHCKPTTRMHTQLQDKS